MERSTEFKSEVSVMMNQFHERSVSKKWLLDPQPEWASDESVPEFAGFFARPGPGRGARRSPTKHANSGPLLAP